MSSNLSILKENFCSKEQIYSYLNSNAQLDQNQQFFSTNQIVSPTSIYQNAFLLLVSTKEFADLIKIDILKNIQDQKDSTVVPESAGNDHFNQYKECIDLTSRLVSATQKCKAGKDYFGFIEYFVEKRKITSLFEFYKELLYVTDVAFTWMCLVQPKEEEKTYQFIINQEINPLHQILSSKMMSSIQPFDMIYNISKTSEIQNSIFHSIEKDAYISPAKLIIFTGVENKIINSDIKLPDYIYLPTNGTQDSVTKTLGRCIAWKSLAEKDPSTSEKSNAVIEKYRKVYPILNYKLAGYVCVPSDEQNNASFSYICNDGNIEVAKSEIKSSSNIICIVYQLQE